MIINHLFKRMLKVSLLVVLVVQNNSFGEGFFAHNQPTKRRQPGLNLKEEIAQKLVDIVHYTSKNIELHAQAQQALHDRLSDLAENKKGAFLNKASRYELTLCLERLDTLKKQQEQELVDIQALLSFTAGGCVEAKKKAVLEDKSTK